MSINFTTKSEYVHNLLKQKILSGELAMGENININKIASETNVSIIPVREALKRLETEGLVDIIPHKGAQVKSFNPEEIKHIYDIRAVLEGLAAKSAIVNMTKEKFDFLRKMTDQMYIHAKNGDDESFGIENKEFHRYIYDQSSNRTLYDMIFNLWEGNWSKAIFAFQPQRMFDAVEEHYEIINAMEEGDEEKTEMLVKQHKLKTATLFTTISKEKINSPKV